MVRSRLLLAASLCVVAAGAGAAAQLAGDLRTALDNPGRPEADKARDEGRKPADVIAFLGFGKGDTVMDMIASGGYYTEVLSNTVGPQGKVYAQNPPFILKYNDGVYDKALTERLANGRLGNVQRVDADFADIDLPPGSLDGAITALNFHDVYNDDPNAATAMLKAMYGLLKPGGVLGLIDHVGLQGADNASLHRVPKQRAIDAAKAAGFEVVGESDLLANPGDDHTRMVFAPGLRGHTDRFLLKLRKPS